MKFFTTAIFVSALSVALSAPVVWKRANINAADVPDFGVTPGIPLGDGSANCKGFNNAAIPCSCPPDRNAFIGSLQANENAGHAVNNPAVAVPQYPAGSVVSREDALTRLDALTFTLQNLNGPGVGCPQVATSFGQSRTTVSALAPGTKVNTNFQPV